MVRQELHKYTHNLLEQEMNKPLKIIIWNN